MLDTRATRDTLPPEAIVEVAAHRQGEVGAPRAGTNEARRDEKARPREETTRRFQTSMVKPQFSNVKNPQKTRSISRTTISQIQISQIPT